MKLEGEWGETQDELEGGSDRQIWSIYIEWMDGISTNKYYFKNCLCVLWKNMKLRNFSTSLGLIIKYLQCPLWLSLPNKEAKIQNVFLSGLAYNIHMNNK